MLLNHHQSSLSFHSELYSLVPDNHLLRKVNESVDFSFINELVKDSYCVYYGRPANEPELLFRLLFLQFLYNLSDERVIEDLQYNLAYKWFLGLNPEDTLPAAVEPDARFGRKSKSKTFYGYKNHIAMTEEEIITAIHVTAGNEDDGKQLQPLVNKTKDQQISIEEV